MTEGADAEHAAVASAMAKSLCEKVNKVVEKNIQKIEGAQGQTGAVSDAGWDTPDTATPQDEAAAKEKTEDAVKTLEAKAKQACDHAMGMARKIAGAGDMMKAAAAKAMADKLCKKVQAVVKME